MRSFIALLAVGMAIITAVPAFAKPVELTIDPVHSSIVFSISHNNGAGKVYGRFNGYSGTITANPDNPAASSVNVTVEASSVDTAVAKRDDHLRTPDFFNVAQFPALTFTSTEVRAIPGYPKMFAVDGELTLLGVTQPLSIVINQLETTTAKDGTFITGFTSTFNIKRSDYGMGYGIPGIGDEVHVELAFECKGPTPPASEQPKA